MLEVPCEPWFLQAGRYAAKGEKPLRATVCLSIEHAYPRDAYVKTSNGITSSCFAGNIRDLNIQRQDGNENVRKKNRFNKQNNFARASRLFVHFFTVSARLRRENA